MVGSCPVGSLGPVFSCGGRCVTGVLEGSSMASVNELDSSHNNNLRETLISAARAKLKVNAVNLYTLLRMWPLN